MFKSLTNQRRLEIGKEEIQHQRAVIIPIPTSHIAVVETLGNLAVISSNDRVNLAIAIQIAIDQRHIVCLFDDQYDQYSNFNALCSGIPPRGRSHMYWSV